MQPRNKSAHAKRTPTMPQETFVKVLIYESGGELRFSQKYLESIVKARKTSTIREGALIFPPHCELLLRFSEESPPLPARVTSCEVKRLKDLRQEEVVADGFRAPEELLSDLRNYYPLLNGESIVTVVSFSLTR